MLYSFYKHHFHDNLHAYFKLHNNMISKEHFQSFQIATGSNGDNI
jgi:hypothetical protein